MSDYTAIQELRPCILNGRYLRPYLKDVGQKQDVYFFTCTVFNPPIVL